MKYRGIKDIIYLFNEGDIYMGINDIKYLFNENEDKITHNSSIKDISNVSNIVILMKMKTKIGI